MNQPELFDSDVHALQERLRAAWKQLATPPHRLYRRELRNQMKQCTPTCGCIFNYCDAPRSRSGDTRSFSKPELRILA